jgi:hypothetical protein
MVEMVSLIRVKEFLAMCKLPHHPSKINPTCKKSINDKYHVMDVKDLIN